MVEVAADLAPTSLPSSYADGFETSSNGAAVDDFALGHEDLA